jgi:hypothetical protein
LTDNSLKVQYRTQTDFLYILYLYGGTYYFYPPLPNVNFPTFGLYAASVFYSPTVFFSANVDVTFAAPYLYGDVTINRPAAPNSAGIVIDGIGTSPPEYSGTLVAAPVHNADDIYGTPAPALASNVAIDVHANAGNLSIQDIAPIEPTSTTVESNTGNISLSVTAYDGFQHTLDVLGNAGTLGVNFQDYGPYSSGYIGLIHTVNVLANTGAINLHDVVNGIGYGIDDQVNLGDNGSLANVRGTINFSNYAGHFGLSVDDRNNPTTSSPWTIDAGQTHIGNLVLNYAGINAPAPYLDIFSKLQAYPKAGSIVSILQAPPFYIREYNGVGGQHTLSFSSPAYLFNQDGDVVNVSLSASSNLGLPLTYSASNLPPGLALNPNTGVISGTIAPQDYLAAPYASTVTVSDGTIAQTGTINWYVSSAINIATSFYAENTHEGETVTLDPITATNSYNRPVTLTVSNLPPGLSFNSNTGVISGEASAGSAQNSPYDVIVHATDGIESASTSFQWSVTGITLTVPSFEIGHVRDTVNLPIQASSSSGGTVTFAADNLPDGLAINPSTGVVSGVLNQNPGYPYYITVTATQGADSQSASFYWTVLSAGVSNSLAITNPGMQTNAVGDYTFFYVLTTSSLSNSQYVPIAVTATGLPPGISLLYGEGYYITGTIAPGAASGSPYHVTITATDGLNSAIANYNWVVATQSTVSIINPAAYSGYVYSTDGDSMNLQIYASSTLGHSLSYSASGLPTGLSINSSTGVISGTISPLATLPSRFDVLITATADTDSASTSFVWIVSSPLPNVVELPNPTGAGMVTITSPDGTSLSASISATAGSTPPGGITFPWGYITLTVTGIAPGGSADVIISPPNSATTTDYFKYGPTPANSGNHWYDFLYQNQTDTDDASTTGAVIQAGGQIVLHLADGLRGDDDLTLNGVISDIGAPAVMIPVIRGDFNRDGHVDGADISAMMRALVDLNAYRINHYLTPDDVITIADINGDGKVTNGDLQALLNLLIGGGGSLTNGENSPRGTAAVFGIGDDSSGTAAMRPTAGSSMPSLLEMAQETESAPAVAAGSGNAGSLIAPATAVIVNDAGRPAAAVVLPDDSNISDQGLAQSQPIIAITHTSNDRGPIANPASSPLSNGQEKNTDPVSIRSISSLLHGHRIENHWLSPMVRQIDLVTPVAPPVTPFTARENFYEQWKFDRIDLLDKALGYANAASDQAQTDTFWSDVFALDDELNDALVKSHATFAEKN